MFAVGTFISAVLPLTSVWPSVFWAMWSDLKRVLLEEEGEKFERNYYAIICDNISLLWPLKTLFA